MIIDFWNLNKALWSLLIFLTFGAVMPQAPVPTLATPQDVASYVLRLPYTGDPVAGVIDFSNAPTVLAGAIETGAAGRLAIDCDDFAVLAYACLKQIKGCHPQLVTLKDASGKFGHHVICVYFQVRQPLGELARGAIDTSGWRALPDATPATLCRVWTELYATRGYHYTEAHPTVYPF